MSLARWLLAEHPFFQDLRGRLENVINFQAPLSLDELVVRSRRPVRTVLLMLNDLLRIGAAQASPVGIERGSPQSEQRHAIAVPQRQQSCPSTIEQRYLNAVVQREVPVLLWSQRRLVPQSVIDRCNYILRWVDRPVGSIVFFGDDDLVSPLFAAVAGGWSVHVADIDQGVLDTAQRVAKELGTTITVHHADISQITAAWTDSYDIVVSDPFPSGDGSFEAMFWARAARVLRPGGISVTTIAPSHKPVGYDRQALSRQAEIGLLLIDLQADFGSFDFEFTPFEKRIMNENRLASSISQTKSIMAARKPRSWQPCKPDGSNDFDFKKWSAATLNHYLTVQAGVDEQQRLAAARGVGAPVVTGDAAPQGLRVDLIVPAELRSQIALESGDPTADGARAWEAVLARVGAVSTADERRELVRLASIADVQSDGPLTELGLAIRAIESWERWRLDA